MLQKPDITAADGVFVTGAGDFPGQFFGTSAAAPNAAAIMALIKSQNPGFTQTQLRSALFATALDIEAPGVDRDSGIGIVMAAAPQPGCTFTAGASDRRAFAAAGGPGAVAAVTRPSGACNWVGVEQRALDHGDRQRRRDRNGDASATRSRPIRARPGAARS